jgi:hypothetical protein
MALMNRLLRASLVAFIALQPLVAMASPSPSPALDGLLAATPASDYKELPATTAGVFTGPFDAKGYVKLSGTPDPANDQKVLEHDGFLSGFGMTWVQQSHGHVLVEAVLAFNGGAGATNWMRQSEAADKKLPSYKNSLTVSGVTNYYGAHLLDTTSGHALYSDGFVVVKGNDAFLVVFASGKDDLGNTASTQAKKQYDTAPEATIKQSEWPESKVVKTALDVARIVGTVVVGILILAVIAVAFVIMRSRRRPGLQPVPVQVGAAVAEPAPVPTVQMSDDRRSWWDGTTWRDAEHEVPPHAQRSGDGHFWWDGQTWRPAPGGPTA